MYIDIMILIRNIFSLHHCNRLWLHFMTGNSITLISIQNLLLFYGQWFDFSVFVYKCFKLRFHSDSSTFKKIKNVGKMFLKKFKNAFL